MFDAYINSDIHNKVPLTIQVLTDIDPNYSLHIKHADPALQTTQTVSI